MMPLLTVAIPTFNRADYLKKCLLRLRDEVIDLDRDIVEILVCDNASTDSTLDVLYELAQSGFFFTINQNTENIGSDRNIAQCFNRARGEYVLILGDDDILCSGTVKWILKRARERRYGVICFKPYGFDFDTEDEKPFDLGRDIIFIDATKFLNSIAPLSTLISSCVVHKSILNSVNAEAFIGGHLVQVHLVFQAALASAYNLYSTKRRVACRRNHLISYDFFDVFVRQFGLILDNYRGSILTRAEIRQIENGMLLRFFPIYLFRLRINRKSDIIHVKRIFEIRHSDKILYQFLVKPILLLPRLIALFFAALATFFGRLYNGDLDLGFARILYWLRRFIREK